MIKRGRVRVGLGGVDLFEVFMSYFVFFFVFVVFIRFVWEVLIFSRIRRLDFFSSWFRVVVGWVGGLRY